jgi:hyperosmotically inducible protein
MRSRITMCMAAILFAGATFAGCQDGGNANGNRPANANRAAANGNSGGILGISSEDLQKAKDEAARLGSKVGQGANDWFLWTKTRAALATADNLEEGGINVDVENGVITLRGSVPDQNQKARAEQVARGIDGVTSVNNTLQVGAPPAGYGNVNGNSNSR